MYMPGYSENYLLGYGPSISLRTHFAQRDAKGDSYHSISPIRYGDIFNKETSPDLCDIEEA